MKDLSFIVLSWALTLGSIALLGVATIRRAKVLATRIPDERKPWL